MYGMRFITGPSFLLRLNCHDQRNPLFRLQMLIPKGAVVSVGREQYLPIYHAKPAHRGAEDSAKDG